MHFNDDSWSRVVTAASLVVFAAMFLGTQRAHADEIYLCEGRRVVILTEANRRQMRADPCVSAWRPAMPHAGKELAAADKKQEPRLDNGPSPLASLVDHNVEQPRARNFRSAEMKITVEKPRKASKRSRKARADNRGHGLRYYGDGIWAQ
jgi:hypothetical protein